jgi:hypothetical protein
MVKIKRRLTLKGQLMNQPIGEPALVSQSKTGYAPQRIREAAYRLKKDGFLFECTEKGIADGIVVTRLQ